MLLVAVAPAALDLGDLREVLVGVVFLLIGVAAILVALALLVGRFAGGPGHRAWPTVEAGVVGSTSTPEPFVGDYEVSEGATYHVVRYRGADGAEAVRAVPPAVGRAKAPGATVTLHVDPTGVATPVVRHSPLLRAAVMLVIGVLCIGLVLAVWL